LIKYVHKIAHATSVKEISVVKLADNKNHGIADFKYKPVFSVFDIGTINPPIELDNTTINIMQAYNFELLKEYNIDSHYIGLIDHNENIISAKEAIENKTKTDLCRVKLVNRIMPDYTNNKWDYSKFKNLEYNNYVLPLEFISRNSLPSSSSVWLRVKNKELNLKELGLEDNFKIGDKVPEAKQPILDYSTKFEPDDRYINKDEAKNILGIDDKNFNYINETTKKISKIMTDYASSRGFTREDGKIEYIKLDNETTVVADAVCTWHEDRLISKQGLNISKQLIRDKIKKLNSEWYENIIVSKELAKKEGHADFRTLMNKKISYISPDINFFESLNNLFRAATNMWINNKYYNLYSEKNEGLEANLNRAIEDFLKVN